MLINKFSNSSPSITKCQLNNATQLSSSGPQALSELQLQKNNGQSILNRFTLFVIIFYSKFPLIKLFTWWFIG